MGRAACLIYGTVCYLLFFGTFLYAIGFAGDMVVPKSIDSPIPVGQASSTSQAALINILLLGVFAIQHSIMARRGFKKHWTKVIPLPVERSTFVLATCMALGLMFWQWRVMPTVVWHLDGPAALWGMRILFFAGFGLVLPSREISVEFPAPVKIIGSRPLETSLPPQNRGIEELNRGIREPAHKGGAEVLLAKATLELGLDTWRLEGPAEIGTQIDRTGNVKRGLFENLGDKLPWPILRFEMEIELVPGQPTLDRNRSGVGLNVEILHADPVSDRRAPAAEMQNNQAKLRKEAVALDDLNLDS